MFELNGNVTPHEEWNVLLLSDIHLDNVKCERRLLKKHLDQAKDKGSPIILNGDTFCAMQGKGDPRKSDEALRSEHRGDNYLNRLVDTATEFFEPYKDNIALVGMGNHEETVLKNHGFDLVGQLCDNLGCLKGDYEGFVKIKRNRKGSSVWLYYNHGFGGGGATKGISAFSKVILKNPADIYWMGHIHEHYAGNEMVRKISEKGRMSLKKQSYIRTSTYKQNDPYLVRKAGSGIRPLGGYWLKTTENLNSRKLKYTIMETED